MSSDEFGDLVGPGPYFTNFGLGFDLTEIPAFAGTPGTGFFGRLPAMSSRLFLFHRPLCRRQEGHQLGFYGTWVVA